MGVVQLRLAAIVIDFALFLNVQVFAVSAGEVGVMQRLLARGCPWDSIVLDAAVQGRWADGFEFAIRHGCPLAGFSVQGLASLSLL
jgi:hypothetical protein